MVRMLSVGHHMPTLAMSGYIPRLIDDKLDIWMETFGAVVLAVPKWIGKTMTCEKRARSAFYFTPRFGQPDSLEIARLVSSGYLRTAWAMT